MAEYRGSSRTDQTNVAEAVKRVRNREPQNDENELVDILL
jgi:hypothetical protein